MSGKTRTVMGRGKGGARCDILEIESVDNDMLIFN